jgi:hypothetical protein
MISAVAHIIVLDIVSLATVLALFESFALQRPGAIYRSP